MLRWNDHKSSPVSGLGLEGYASEMTVREGARIGFSLSGPPASARVNLSRLIHADPNPDGPGYKEEGVEWGQPETVDLVQREIDFGSYLEIPSADSLNPSGPFTLSLWFCPTLLHGGWHALVSVSMQSPLHADADDGRAPRAGKSTRQESPD